MKTYKSVLYTSNNKHIDLYDFGSPVLFTEFIQAPSPYQKDYNQQINGIYYFDKEENIYIIKTLYQGDKINDDTFKYSIKTDTIQKILNAIKRYKILRKLRILLTTLYLLQKHFYDVMEFTYRPNNNGYIRVNAHFKSLIFSPPNFDP